MFQDRAAPKSISSQFSPLIKTYQNILVFPGRPTLMDFFAKNNAEIDHFIAKMKLI